MLTKPQNVTYVPGKPAVEARPPYEVCTSGEPGTAPPGGHWERQCTETKVPVGVITGPTPGAFPVDPGPFPYVLYQVARICKDVWVEA